MECWRQGVLLTPRKSSPGTDHIGVGVKDCHKHGQYYHNCMM